VVEDFEILARSIATGLRREGMAVDVVAAGDAAVGALGQESETDIGDDEDPGTATDVELGGRV
jgi:hypothetical protein